MTHLEYKHCKGSFDLDPIRFTIYYLVSKNLVYFRHVANYPVNLLAKEGGFEIN